MLPNTRVFQMKQLSNQNVFQEHCIILPFSVVFLLLVSLTYGFFHPFFILRRTHLKDNYVPIRRPVQTHPKNKAFFSLFLEDAILHGRPYPKILCLPEIRRTKENIWWRNQEMFRKATPSHLTTADAVNKVSLKEREATKAGSFEGCGPWIGSHHLSRLSTLNIETIVLQLLFNKRCQLRTCDLPFSQTRDSDVLFILLGCAPRPPTPLSISVKASLRCSVKGVVHTVEWALQFLWQFLVGNSLHRSEHE